MPRLGNESLDQAIPTSGGFYEEQDETRLSFAGTPVTPFSKHSRHYNQKYACMHWYGKNTALHSSDNVRAIDILCSVLQNEDISEVS